ncbi:MAG: hypothetical protein ACRDHS_08440 [Actinomycetota bacterium]
MDEHESPTELIGDPVLPVLPPPAAPQAQAFAWSPGPHGTKRPWRLGIVAGAAGLVVAIVAALVVFQVTQPESRARAALAFAFGPGDTTGFRQHITMDGTISAGVLGTQPLAMDMTQTIRWEVMSVDDDGVATVEIRIEDTSGTVNGISVPGIGSDQSFTMRISPDGQILTANGLAFGGSADAGGMGIPGMDQVTPVLPDHPVSPGDTWVKRFSQEFPFGKGAIEYTARSTFDRYEDVDGSRTAVITTRYAMPIDLTIDVGELFEAFGGSLGATRTEPSELADAKMIYTGSGSFAMTSWLDLTSRELVKSSSSGDFDMTMRITGFPEAVAFPAKFSFDGTFTQELERI